MFRTFLYSNEEYMCTVKKAWEFCHIFILKKPVSRGDYCAVNCVPVAKKVEQFSTPDHQKTTNFPL